MQSSRKLPLINEEEIQVIHSKTSNNIPYYGERVPRSKWLPFYKSRKVGEKWLLTNRMGDWELLTSEEYEYLNHLFVPVKLIERLATKQLVLYEDNAKSLLDNWENWNPANLRLT